MNQVVQQSSVDTAVGGVLLVSHPCGGNDLPTVPAATVEIELADLGHVPWTELEITEPGVTSLRVDRPGEVRRQVGVEILDLVQRLEGRAGDDAERIEEAQPRVVKD